MHLLTSAEAVHLKNKIVGQGYDFATVILDKDRKLLDITSTLELKYMKCFVDKLVRDNEQLNGRVNESNELEVLQDGPPDKLGWLGLCEDSHHFLQSFPKLVL